MTQHSTIFFCRTKEATSKLLLNMASRICVVMYRNKTDVMKFPKFFTDERIEVRRPHSRLWLQQREVRVKRQLRGHVGPRARQLHSNGSSGHDLLYSMMLYNRGSQPFWSCGKLILKKKIGGTPKCNKEAKMKKIYLVCILSKKV